jgi:sigma-B regulation protein RsbU (phosphoserine phosphatase)
MPSMPWLIALDGGLTGRRFPLDTTFLVGRGPYNHVVIDDVRISRQHAKISPEAGGHVVHDLNSANGSFVNDEPIQKRELYPGDVVRFGPFRFRFEADPDTDISIARPMRRQHRAEELTRRGFEVPTKIVGAVDAATALKPGLVELEDADRKLTTLYAFVRAISATLDQTELLDLVVKSLLDVFPAAQIAAVYMLDRETKRMEPLRLLQRNGRPVPDVMVTALPYELHLEIVQKGRATLSAPMSLTFDDEAPASGGLMMHVPMLYGTSVLGVLNVRARPESAFSQSDLDLFTALAAHAALALTGARMHQESLARERLAQDLVLAQQIQKSFLPSVLPVVEGVAFVADYEPAYSIGGDFYDVFWITPERIGVIIGDVSGKGVSAALLMARVSSDLRAAMLRARPDGHLRHGALPDHRRHDALRRVRERRAFAALRSAPSPGRSRARGRRDQLAARPVRRRPLHGRDPRAGAAGHARPPHRWGHRSHQRTRPAVRLRRHGAEPRQRQLLRGRAM